LLREHRLYQADWLLRFYGFSASELLNDENPNFDTDFDPKTNWALNNIGKFPIEINNASYDTLLRIPGLGVRSAKRIIAARRVHYLSFDDVKKLGVVIKRARYFITCKGKYYGEVDIDSESIKTRLITKPIVESLKDKPLSFEQLSLFPQLPVVYDKLDFLTRINGEL
jgi:predicted DNA-binding helix-hairpin-helix protein